MVNIDTPCKDCEVREVGCHIKCPMYKEYSKQCERINKNRRDQRLYRPSPEAICFSHNSKMLTEASHKRRD